MFETLFALNGFKKLFKVNMSENGKKMNRGLAILREL